MSTNGVVNIKKLYAVSELTKIGYDYMITIDADFAFNRNVNLFDICERFFAEKIIIGTFTNHELLQRINVQCLLRFTHNPKIQSIPVNWYSWLNQPCIYKATNVKKFFDKIGDTENFNKYTFGDFDYILYTYYLILYEDFRPYTIPNWSVELDTFSETKVLPKNFSLEELKDVHLLVCNKYLYFWIQQNKLDNEFMMIIHLDR